MPWFTREGEVRHKPKTKGGYKKAGRVVAERSAWSASELTTDPVPQKKKLVALEWKKLIAERNWFLSVRQNPTRRASLYAL